MAHRDPVLRALCRGLTPWQQVEVVASRQGRAIDRRQLADCELTRTAIRTAVDRRQLNRVHRGVYAVGIRRLGSEGALWAAILATGADTAIGRDSAAALVGFRPEPGAVHVAAPVSRRHHDGVVVHRADGMHAGWVRRRGRLPVLKTSHVLLDLATDLRPEALTIAVSQALALRAVTVGELETVLETRPRHRGRRRLAVAIAAEVDDPGAGRTHGELENLVLLLLRDLPGLPPYRRNELVELGGGRIAKADMLFPGLRVMIELDSREWHEQRAAMDSDRRRDQQALAVGLVTFRLTWRHATREWDQVSADLLDTLRRRGVDERAAG